MYPTSTPSRPRPPAMARRISTKSGPELDRPPPYIDQRANVVSSTLFVGMAPVEKSDSTRDVPGLDVGDTPASPTAVNTALNGRSRAELEEMLLTAHNIIRKHESGAFQNAAPRSTSLIATPDYRPDPGQRRDPGPARPK